MNILRFSSLPIRNKLVVCFKASVESLLIDYHEPHSVQEGSNGSVATELQSPCTMAKDLQFVIIDHHGPS